MSKNRRKQEQQLVRIPIEHVCITAYEYAKIRELSALLREENGNLQRELKDVKEKNNMLKGELEAAKTKIVSLKETVDEKQDRILYWYQKYTDLADKLNAVKTVKTYAEAEKT